MHSSFLYCTCTKHLAWFPNTPHYGPSPDNSSSNWRRVFNLTFTEATFVHIPVPLHQVFDFRFALLPSALISQFSQCSHHSLIHKPNSHISFSWLRMVSAPHTYNNVLASSTIQKLLNILLQTLASNDVKCDDLTSSENSLLIRIQSIYQRWIGSISPSDLHKSTHGKLAHGKDWTRCDHDRTASADRHLQGSI